MDKVHCFLLVEWENEGNYIERANTYPRACSLILSSLEAYQPALTAFDST